jgi:hypothetical protein
MTRTRVLVVAAIIVLACGVAAAWPAGHGQRPTLRIGAAQSDEQEATRLVGTASCGIERWSVKTLTDADANKVKFTPVHAATVGYLGSLARTPGGQSSRGRLETWVYAVTAKLTRVKRESDSDYHLVLTAAGKSMIAEMPFSGCDVGGRHRVQMTGARTALEGALGGPVGSSWRYTSLRVRVVGVLFFDFAHGQTGHAANYVELHPVLGFRIQ